MSGRHRKPSPVHPYSLRRVCTLDEDTVENPGVYLVLDGDPPAPWRQRGVWRYLVLVGDPDLDSEASGEIKTDSSGWLADWSEPWEP